MTCKTFRIDWYPKDAYIDLAKLPAEEIGLLLQTMNLIYMHNRAIDFEPKHIAKSCCMGAKKCDRLLHNLIDKGYLELTEDKKLKQKRCMIELENVDTRRKKQSESARLSHESRRRNKEKQIDNISTPNSDLFASTRTSKRNSNNTSTNNESAFQESLKSSHSNHKARTARPYNIEYHLNDTQRTEAKKNAPRMDLQALMHEYNENINEGKKDPPEHPAKAFLAWCKVVAKSHGFQ